MRDRFAASSGPTFSVGSEGGPETHTHDFTTDGHKHTIPEVTGIDAALNNFYETTTETISGTTDAANNLPKYYALAYIMYLGT